MTRLRILPLTIKSLLLSPRSESYSPDTDYCIFLGDFDHEQQPTIAISGGQPNSHRAPSPVSCGPNADPRRHYPRSVAPPPARAMHIGQPRHGVQRAAAPDLVRHLRQPRQGVQRAAASDLGTHRRPQRHGVQRTAAPDLGGHRRPQRHDVQRTPASIFIHASSAPRRP
jgi:hypothetical protein